VKPPLSPFKKKFLPLEEGKEELEHRTEVEDDVGVLTELHVFVPMRT
jgi:hypothetical protein